MKTYPHCNTRHATLYYRIALCGVREIDEHLEKGDRHYRNRAGVLLTTLDEVVRGMLEDDLREPSCQ